MRISEQQARAALERLRAGKTTVRQESDALGFKYNMPLRNAIIALIGRDAYLQLARDSWKRSRTTTTKRCSPISPDSVPTS